VLISHNPKNRGRKLPKPRKFVASTLHSYYGLDDRLLTRHHEAVRGDMVPTCSECQHLLRVYVTADDPPMYWCNNPATKEFCPPTGYVRREAPFCKLFTPIEHVREHGAGKPAGIPADDKPREKRALETRMVVGFCLLMTLSTLIPTLLHEGERAVIAFSDFVRTCKGAVELALGSPSPAKAIRARSENRSADTRSDPPSSKREATIVPKR